MIPPDYSKVAEESPREACANLAMEFREMAQRYRDMRGMEGGADLYVNDDDCSAWASRLERAVRKLDAEQSPLDGPWGIVGTPDAPGICYVTDSPLIARLGPLIEAEAIAVRDALNKLGAVPPAEQDTPQ